MIELLLSKLGHVQAHFRDAASIAILEMADTDNIGATYAVLRVVKSGKGSSWRSLKCKLKILRAIVLEHHCGKVSGISAKTVMSFMSRSGAHTHANAEVREAARELSVAVFLDIGHEIEQYLDSLRPVQLDEYHVEFEKVKNSQKNQSK